MKLDYDKRTIVMLGDLFLGLSFMAVFMKLKAKRCSDGLSARTLQLRFWAFFLRYMDIFFDMAALTSVADTVNGAQTAGAGAKQFEGMMGGLTLLVNVIISNVHVYNLFLKVFLLGSSLAFIYLTRDRLFSSTKGGDKIHGNDTFPFSILITFAVASTFAAFELDGHDWRSFAVEELYTQRGLVKWVFVPARLLSFVLEGVSMVPQAWQMFFDNREGQNDCGFRDHFMVFVALHRLVTVYQWHIDGSLEQVVPEISHNTLLVHMSIVFMVATLMPAMLQYVLTRWYIVAVVGGGVYYALQAGFFADKFETYAHVSVAAVCSMFGTIVMGGGAQILSVGLLIQILFYQKQNGVYVLSSPVPK